MVLNEVRTRTTVSRLDADGILHVTYLPGVEETLADAEENFRSGTAAWGEHRRPVLVDAREVKSLNRDVRQYHSRPEAMRNVSALAMLVSSPLSSLIANFFITMTKVNVPTRIFTDETEARDWLKGFVE
jgi:hypothetical protein